MIRKKKQTEQAAKLRLWAEEINRTEVPLEPDDLSTLTPEKIRQIAYQLRVHQIELELQNEELRQTQLELDATRAKYFDLYDLAPIGYCTVNAEGLIQEANLTAGLLLGVARGELTKRPFSRFILNEDQDLYYLHRKQLFATGIPQVFELRMIRKDETIVWTRLDLTLSHDPAGTPSCWLMLSDIAKAKRDEQILLESESRFRKILQDVPSIAVQGYGADGTTQYWNHASELLYGYSAQEAIGRHLLDLIIPPEMRKDFEQAIKQMAETGQPIPAAELSLMRKDGSRIAVFSSHAVFQIPGRRPELFCIDIDLTRRKQIEETLRQSETRLQIAYDQLQTACEEQQQRNNELTRLFKKSQRTEADLSKANQHLNRQTADLAAINTRVENDKRLLASMMEALPTGVAITDKSGGTVRTNKAYEKIWGEPLPKTRSVADYAPYQAWWDETGKRVAPEEWASAIAVQTGKPSIGQMIRIQRFDGAEAYVINSACPVYNSEGEIVGSAVAIQDVTTIKQAEKDLLQNKKDFARAQEVGSIGSWRLDVQQNVLSWSDEIYRIFGIPTGAPLNYETFLSNVHPDDRMYVDTQWKVALGGEPYDIEHRLMVDGKIKWVREKAYLEFTRDGILVGGFGITQDITERKEIETTLQKNQEELQIILDSSPIMIFYKDTENRFIRVNKTLAEITGLPKEAIEGKTVFEVYPNQVKDYWEDDKEVMASGRPKIGIIEPIDSATGQRWVQTDKFPYRDKDGRIIGIIGFAVDITGRKQAEEQLLAINNELEQRVENRTRELQEAQLHYLHAEKLAAIGKLSASIAHEFNNPLQGIMSIMKGLRKRAILEEEDRELLEAAISESERIKSLIRSLQDFNRPSSGKKVVMDVQRSIDSVLLLCKNDFKSNRISVMLNYAEGLPQILAIPDQIKQVFLNLLTNAADSCLLCGGVIKISTWQEDQSVAVAIKDTGIGIEPEKIGLIFQPFYTTKTAVKGTGLGLSVCHGIIQNHQGEIRVASQPGEGSTFTVLLPIKINSDEK